MPTKLHKNWALYPMKNLDYLSKRILVVAVSLSIVLLSLSAFLLTLQRVTAAPNQVGVVSQPSIVGLGVSGNKGYYMVLTGNEYHVMYKNLK